MNRKIKRCFNMAVSATLVVGVLAACGGERGSKNTGGPSAGGERPDIKVALVINQRFGDKGPMDDLAAGADRAEKDFGVTVKRLESASAANYEADVRAMAQQGYNLIFTTFPYMEEATKIAAKEYPDTKFGAIFQNVNNASGEKYSNIWDTEFHGEAAFYIAGYVAGLNTKSNQVGIIIGGEEPSPNAEGNGFMRGALAANPNVTVTSAFVGSYEDPAKAKEIAGAMIDKGIDYIQNDAAASNAGVVEIAKEKDVLVAGELTDYYAQYKGFTGIVGIGFGDTLYKGVEAAVEGEFSGGQHGIRDLSNGGYFIDWDSYTRFANENADFGSAMKDAIEKAKKVEADLIAGTLKVEYDTQAPNWDRIKSAK